MIPTFLPLYRASQLGEHLAHLLGASAARVKLKRLALGALDRGGVVQVEHPVLLGPVAHGRDLVEADAAEEEERVLLPCTPSPRHRVLGVVVVVLVGDLDLAAVDAARLVVERLQYTLRSSALVLNAAP